MTTRFQRRRWGSMRPAMGKRSSPVGLRCPYELRKNGSCCTDPTAGRAVIREPPAAGVMALGDEGRGGAGTVSSERGRVARPRHGIAASPRCSVGAAVCGGAEGGGAEPAGAGLKRRENQARQKPTREQGRHDRKEVALPEGEVAYLEKLRALRTEVTKRERAPSSDCSQGGAPARCLLKISGLARST